MGGREYITEEVLSFEAVKVNMAKLVAFLAFGTTSINFLYILRLLKFYAVTKRLAIHLLRFLQYLFLFD